MSDFPSALQPAIDVAPGKELLARLRAGGEYSLLNKFFDVRLAWSGGYPFISNGPMTFGAFQDIPKYLDSEKRLSLLPIAMQIAMNCPNRHLHAALSLIEDLIPDDAIHSRPEGFSDYLLRLRLRAEKLSFLPNLTCTWAGLMNQQRLLQSSSDPLAGYSPKELEIADDSWQRFFSYPLVNFDNKLFAELSVRMDVLRDRVQQLGAMPGERRLIYSTRVDNSKYWVWRIPGKSGTAHLCKIIFLRQSAEGNCELGNWDLYHQFPERDTPDFISRRLLEIEFYPTILESLS